MTRRRFLYAPLAAIATVLLSTVSLSSAASGASLSLLRPSGPNCGTTVYKADRTKWVCTFDDEFSGTKLDTTKWTAWNDVNYWAYQEPNICYYDDPQHLSVRGGFLNLTVAPLSAPADCATSADDITATYGAAVVHTKGKFSQTTGRFAARIKFAGGVGLHNDFWLYPTQSTYPGRAEIDIAEPWGWLPNTMVGATHVTGPAGTDVGASTGCLITNWASAFHTYVVEWTTTSIKFIYDNKTCFTYSDWTPMDGYSAPAPFDQDFFMILQVLVDSGIGSPAPQATTAFPATMKVDWVHVWK
jgi:beta-glucanase (GH16 family)